MYLNVKKDIKASIRLIKLNAFVLMYLHFVACFWFLIVEIERKWIPPLHFRFGWEVQGDFFDQEKSYKYSVCFYYSCISIFGTDSSPRSNLEICVVCMMDILGAFIQATMFGEIANLIY